MAFAQHLVANPGLLSNTTPYASHRCHTHRSSRRRRNQLLSPFGFGLPSPSSSPLDSPSFHHKTRSSSRFHGLDEDSSKKKMSPFTSNRFGGRIADPKHSGEKSPSATKLYPSHSTESSQHRMGSIKFDEEDPKLNNAQSQQSTTSCLFRFKRKLNLAPVEQQQRRRKRASMKLLLKCK